MSMHRIKLVTWIVMLTLSVWLLAGCGGKEDSGKDDQQTDKQTESVADEGEEKDQASEQAPEGEEKTVTVSVTHKDESVKDFTYTTKYEVLGDLLRGEDLVDGIEGSAGYYVTTVDGEEAIDRKQEWWMVKKNGEMTQTGVDSTQMEDGDSFEFVFTTGYY